MGAQLHFFGENMRKIIILLVAILLIGTIAVSGCTKQIPEENNQIDENQTTNITATPTKTPTGIPTIAPNWPTYNKPTAWPTPLPTPTPKPICTHVDIEVYHPLNFPCMMCTERYATLSNDYKDNQYVTVKFVEVSNSSWTENSPRITATVRETGESKEFGATGGGIEAWVNEHLTCKY